MHRRNPCKIKTPVEIITGRIGGSAVTARTPGPTHFRGPALAFLAALFLRGHPPDGVPAADLAELRVWHDADPPTYHTVAGVEPADCPHCPEETK